MQSSYRKPLTTFLTSHGPRHPAQQGHLRAQSCDLRLFLKRRPAKIHGAWCYSSFEAFCAALLSQAPHGHVFSVHIHNVGAKKREASIDLLRRLHGYMHQHNVDFIGGDFNMSAFSTVGDVFSDPEFAAPATRTCGVSADWTTHVVKARGSSSCRSIQIEWRVDSHGCYKFNDADLALGSRDSSAHFPVFLHLRTTNLPGPTASRAANKLSKDGLRAYTTDQSEGRDDVDFRDVVYHDHVSAHFPTPSTVTSESFARMLFPLH